MEPDNIKPCSFCGSAHAEISHAVSIDAAITTLFYVRCKICGAQGPTYPVPLRYEDIRGAAKNIYNTSAIGRWNNRRME